MEGHGNKICKKPSTKFAIIKNLIHESYPGGFFSKQKFPWLFTDLAFFKCCQYGITSLTDSPSVLP